MSSRCSLTRTVCVCVCVSTTFTCICRESMKLPRSPSRHVRCRHFHCQLNGPLSTFLCHTCLCYCNVCFLYAFFILCLFLFVLFIIILIYTCRLHRLQEKQNRNTGFFVSVIRDKHTQSHNYVATGQTNRTERHNIPNCSCLFFSLSFSLTSSCL